MMLIPRRLAALFSGVVTTALALVNAPLAEAQRVPLEAEHAVVTSAHALASEAGVEILKKGGNAVDAGIACALVQGVVDPQMCGIAGFGSCGIYMPGKKFHGYIDAHAPAPLAARPDMWANLIESEARDGYGRTPLHVATFARQREAIRAA